MARSRRSEVVRVSAELRKLGRKEKWTPEEAATIVDAWRASGAPLAGFARAMKVGAQRIRNWRDGWNPGAARTPQLLPVKVTGLVRRPVAAAVVQGGRMEIGLGGGRCVRVGTDFDASAVARLVTTLEQLGC